jgi:UDP-N-acetylmuramoyl-L-alanyl-D-glutamate--2,6-diaminopimelate ligase
VRQLLKGIEPLKISGNLHIVVAGIRYDSRKVRPGDIFVCIKGFRHDGHEYVQDAIANGACAIVAENDVPVQDKVTLVIVDNTRKALGILARNFYGAPSDRLFVAGVTGTNGKTTTTFLAKAVLEREFKKVALTGTIVNMIGTEYSPAERTTPESLDIIAFLDEALSQSAEAAVMEVSSHAVSLDRLSGLEFDCGVFTNFTQDHLDFYDTVEEYLDAKGRFFEMLGKSGRKNATAFINADDPSSDKISTYVKSARLMTYGIQKSADIKGVNVELYPQGVEFSIEYNGKVYPVFLKLHGMFNVYNALSAFCIGVAKGMEPELVIEGLESVTSVPGRFESIDCGQNFTVIVDYAHTPDGLLKVLHTARAFALGRLIVLFGCGGDRDKTKRPVMGRVAFENSDFTVITSDNPRSEDPEAIAKDIERGFIHTGGRYAHDYCIILDRYDAIVKALSMALPGDVVLICGKGHETYQIIGDTRIDFDDRQVVRKIMEEIIL